MDKPTQMLASRNDTAFPIEVSVDTGTGGISGLTAAISIRDTLNSNSYLDFNDSTFKITGWVSKTKNLADFGSGFYGTTIDIAGIKNFPNGGNHLAVEYSVTGAVVSIANNILSFNLPSDVWNYTLP